MSLLLCLYVQTIAQDWRYAKVWLHKADHSLARMKLVPADGSDPLYIVSRQAAFPDQKSWDWMSEEGGVLRLFPSDSPATDSALLITGQSRWTAYWEQDSWFLPEGNQPLRLKKQENIDGWLLEVVLEPIDGVESFPEPILILRIFPHPKKKNRFLIETTGNLQSIPTVQIELGIALALVSSCR